MNIQPILSRRASVIRRRALQNTKVMLAYAEAKNAMKQPVASSGDDWVCDYWKSIYEDFATEKAYWRTLYDLNDCEPPHEGECLTYNQQIIEATQNMNLTKQYAADDGCDTSGW